MKNRSAMSYDITKANLHIYINTEGHKKNIIIFFYFITNILNNA